MSRCDGPECGNSVVSVGLCSGHLKQRAKGVQLHPLRRRMKPGSNGGPCDFAGCANRSISLGLCRSHYEQQSKGKPLTPLRVFVRGGAPCSVEGCPSKAHAGGLCQKHYDLKRENRPGTLEQRRTRLLRHHYGITLEQYNQMHEGQNGLCAMCGKPEAHSTHRLETKWLSVDHDHETGRLRELLCAHCNTLLGLGDDDPLLLIAGALYLHKHGRPGMSSELAEQLAEFLARRALLTPASSSGAERKSELGGSPCRPLRPEARSSSSGEASAWPASGGTTAMPQWS